MKHDPYLQFRERQLTLNDLLAIDRTVLANERTVLAYARTAMALLAIGGSCIKFFDSWWIEIVGLIFIAMAAVLAAVGWVRFRRVQRWVSTLPRGSEAPTTAGTAPPASHQPLPPTPRDHVRGAQGS